MEKSPLPRAGKQLLVVLLVGLTISAVVAPAAQATPKFTAAQYPALFTGESFATQFETSRKLVCGSSSLKGELTGAVTTLTLVPGYSECNVTVAENKTPATFEIQGCTYTFSLGETASKLVQAEGYGYTGNLTLTCPAEQEVKTRFYLNGEEHKKEKPVCVFGIPSQSNVGAVDYGTAGSPAKLKLRTRTTTLAYFRRSGLPVNCPAEGTISLTGVATVEAKSPELNPLAVTLDME